MSLRSPAVLHPHLQQSQLDDRDSTLCSAASAADTSFSSSSLPSATADQETKDTAGVAAAPGNATVASAAALTAVAASGGPGADADTTTTATAQFAQSQKSPKTSVNASSSRWIEDTTRKDTGTPTEVEKNNKAESQNLNCIGVTAGETPTSSPGNHSSNSISSIHNTSQRPRPVPLVLAESSPDLRHNHESVSSKDSFPAVKPVARPSRSLYHRRGVRSIDAIPRQTIMKALASRPPPVPPPTAAPSSSLAIASSIDDFSDLNHQDQQKHQRSNSAATAPGGTAAGRSSAINSGGSDAHLGKEGMRGRLSAALANYNLDLQGGTPLSASKLAVLASPCFYHKRFDDAVNIDRVLEEIQADETMSHSRLMQTATGVREVSKQLQRRPCRRAVHNIMIITKARDNQLVSITRDLAEWLLSTPRYGSDIGVTVYVDAKLRKSKRFDAAGLVAKDARFGEMLKFWTPALCCRTPEKFDLVLTLGGDGTVLYTSWLFQRIVPPILSFSLGSLGFLTNFRIEDYKSRLGGMMGDEGMRVSLRMRFTCTVYRCSPVIESAKNNNDNDKAGSGSSSNEKIKTKTKKLNSPASPIEAEQFEVLNELVIDRGPSPYVSNLELYGDDSLLTVIQADGCIFSTPTGSTAYSLSAGGSLVHPDIPAILLTPICPHTLSFRPMLLNDTMLLRVAVPRDSRATAYCSFDGKGRVELRQGDHVTIAVSQYPFPTVLNRPTDWFDSISRTLRWNNRGAQQKGWDGGAGVSASGKEKKSGDGDDEDDEDAVYQDGEGEGEKVGDGEGEKEKEGEAEREFDIDFDDVEDDGEGYNDCSH